MAGRAEPSRPRATCPTTPSRPTTSIDKLVIWGSPQKVADELLAFREEVGDFGTLLYAGKDWLDRDLGRRSMVLMAEKVLPARQRRHRAQPARRRSRLGQAKR